MVSGLVIGFAFGMAAIGGIALGAIADTIGLKNMLFIVFCLPVLGIMTVFLPNDLKRKQV